MKVIITGGCGFIGSHLVKRCVEKGLEVMVVDDLTTGALTNVFDLCTQAELKKVNVNLYSILELSNLVRDFSRAVAVFHLAARPSVPYSLENPILTHEVNSTGTLTVFEAAHLAQVPKVIYTSSSSVQEMASPYAIQKMTGEYYARVYRQIHKMSIVTLRLFNVYGPNQDPESPYAAVVPRFLKDKRPAIYGDGEQTRALTYVGDVVDALMRSLRTRTEETIDIGSDTQVTINELFEQAAEIRFFTKPAIRKPARPGEVRYSVPDLKNAKKYLKWKAKVSLAEGLKRTKEALCEY